MNTLIVYYTLEGNTEYAANRIKEKTGADVLKLIPKKAYHDKGFKKFFFGGKSAVMGEKPELEAYTVDLSSYEQIVFAFPVWASHVTPPIRTFVVENEAALKGKSFSVFACQSGNGAQKAFKDLAKLLGIESFRNSAVFIDPKARPEASKDQAIDAFAGKLMGN